MGTEMIILILSILCITFLFTTINLLRKQEKSEDILLGYLIYLDKISKIIEISNNRLKKLDIKGIFESDDEIGFFFKEVKEIQKILDEFDLKKLNG